MSTDIVSETIFGTIKRHWKGQGTLAWAFWGFGVCGGLILFFLLAFSSLFALLVAYEPDRSVLSSPLFVGYLVVACFFCASHTLVTWIMVWRCGDNVQWVGWKYVSRALVLMGIAYWIINLLLLLHLFLFTDSKTNHTLVGCWYGEAYQPAFGETQGWLMNRREDSTFAVAFRTIKPGRRRPISQIEEGRWTYLNGRYITFTTSIKGEPVVLPYVEEYEIKALSQKEMVYQHLGSKQTFSAKKVGCDYQAPRSELGA